MAQLSRTFPDLDPALTGLVSKASEVEKHPKIHLHCYSELEDVKGYRGEFRPDDPEEGHLRRWGESALAAASVSSIALWNMLLRI